MNRMIGLAFAAAAACAFGAEKTVTWSAAETPASVADGTVGLAYDGAAVKSLVASNGPADRVTFTGEAMSLADGAQIVIGPGALAFSNSVAAAGSVAFGQWTSTFTYGSFKPNDTTSAAAVVELACQISGTPKVILPSDDLGGTTLAAIEIVDGMLAGGSVAQGINVRMYPYREVRSADGKKLTVQMQGNDGSWNKCVKLELEQKDDGIWATSLYARYGNISDYPLGNDFDENYFGSMNVGSAGSWGSYVVKGVTFAYVASDERLTVAAPFTTQGEAALTNAEVTVTGAGAIGPDANAVAPLSLRDSTLAFSNCTVSVFALTNSIRGQNSTLAFSYPDPSVNEEVEKRIEGSNTTFKDGVWVEVARNATLADVTGISAPHMIQSYNLVDMGEGAVYFFEKTGSSVTCQMQVHHGDWNKCAFLEIKQDGLNLKAHVYKANWQYHKDAPLGTDLSTGYAGTSGCNYYPSAFTLHLKYASQTVQANSTNELRDSTIVVGTNVVYNVNLLGAIPYKYAGATVDVLAGGVMNLNVNGDNAYGINNGTAIRIRKGGVVNQSKSGTFSQIATVTVDGGTLALATAQVGGGSSWDVGTYLDLLTFRDGGRTTGLAPRVGARDSTWKVEGTGEACSHLGGVVLVNDNHVSWGFSRRWEWTLDVADVTGDDAADFTFGGHVDDYVATKDYKYYGMKRIKTGAGTMRIAPETWSTSLTGRWDVVEGTLLVGASDAMSAARGYELALKGGTLALEANVTNSFAAFPYLTKDSAIALGAGAALDLPGAPDDWTDGATLAVTLGEGARLRFGTDNTSLTRAQLALISVNGERAKLEADGTIKPRKFGTAVIIR